MKVVELVAIGYLGLLWCAYATERRARGALLAELATQYAQRTALIQNSHNTAIERRNKLIEAARLEIVKLCEMQNTMRCNRAEALKALEALAGKGFRSKSEIFEQTRRFRRLQKLLGGSA